MKDLNIIQWAVKQPKDILVGIVIFASSYLVFLSVFPGEISIGEHFLWFLLFLSSSLLLGYFLSFLCRESYMRIKYNRIANNNRAIKILKSINKIENGLSQDSTNMGFPIPFSVDVVSECTGIDIGTIKRYRDSFSKIKFVRVALNGNIVGLSPAGRDFLFKHKLME